MGTVAVGLRHQQIQKGPDDFIAFGDLDSNDRDNLVVMHTELSIVILNRFPYNNGHVLVAPRRAVPDLADMSEAELLDCQRWCSGGSWRQCVRS